MRALPCASLWEALFSVSAKILGCFWGSFRGIILLLPAPLRFLCRPGHRNIPTDRSTSCQCLLVHPKGNETPESSLPVTLLLLTFFGGRLGVVSEAFDPFSLLGCPRFLCILLWISGRVEMVRWFIYGQTESKECNQALNCRSGRSQRWPPLWVAQGVGASSSSKRSFRHCKKTWEVDQSAMSQSRTKCADQLRHFSENKKVSSRLPSLQ